MVNLPSQSKSTLKTEKGSRFPALHGFLSFIATVLSGGRKSAVRSQVRFLGSKRLVSPSGPRKVLPHASGERPILPDPIWIGIPSGLVSGLCCPLMKILLNNSKRIPFSVWAAVALVWFWALTFDLTAVEMPDISFNCWFKPVPSHPCLLLGRDDVPVIKVRRHLGGTF